MLKYFVGLLFLAVASCSSVPEPETLTKPLMANISGVCQNERYAETLFDAILKQEDEIVQVLTTTKACSPILEDVSVPVVKILRKEKDKNDQDFWLVFVVGPDGNQYYAIYWPINDQPKGQGV